MDKKRMFAVAAVGMLLLTGAGVVITRNGSQPARAAAASPEKYPIPPPNVAVATGPAGNAEPSIAISPADPDTMVVVASDFNTPTGEKWDGFSTTHDGGKTWKQKLLPGYPGGPVSTLTGYGGMSDPVVVADSAGNFYYSGLGFKWNPRIPGRFDTVFVAKSMNKGDSFDQIVGVCTSFIYYTRYYDKDWIAVDHSNGNIYLVWDLYNLNYTCRLAFSRSTDGGLRWSKPLTIEEAKAGAGNFMGAGMVVDNNGVIHVTWMEDLKNEVHYARSTDHGQSFCTPIVVAPFTNLPDRLPNNDYRSLSMTQLAVDTGGTNTSGSLYVTWDDYGTKDADILLSASHDGGITWSDPVRVNNDTECNGIDQFMPTVAVSPEGWVHVGFYDRRCDPNDTLLEYWWAISFDGGASFPVNMPMSNATFDGADSPGYPQGYSDFMGDYTSMAADNGTVAAVWCDTRNGSASAENSDIYGAVVPYNEMLRTNKFANVTIPWPKESGG